MRSSSNILLGLLAVAFLLVPVSVGDTFAAGSRVTKYDSPYARTTPQEEVKKMKGVVVKREPDSFTMSETTGGPTTTVNLTSSTEVKSHKKGVFRGSKDYAASYILRGLRLEVDGVRFRRVVRAQEAVPRVNGVRSAGRLVRAVHHDDVLE